MIQSAEFAALEGFKRNTDLPIWREVRIPLERVFTPEQVAEYLSVDRSTVWKLLKAGKLESFKPYVNRRRVTESQLSRFIQRASTDPDMIKGGGEE